MMTKWPIMCSLCVVLVLAVGEVAPTAGAAATPTAPEPVLEDRYPSQVVAFPGNVTSRASLVYATYPGYRPLTLDLYTKASRGGRPRPLIVYVHGGGWEAGHSRQSGAFANFPGVLADLAARGYVVAAVNYRLSGEARFPAAIQDVKLAIRWLRAHAGDFGIDVERVIVWGASAGGQLAGLAATSCGQVALAPAPPAGKAATDAALAVESDCIQGAAIWYGVLDLLHLHPGAGPATAEARYLGCDVEACPAQARLASPTLLVGPDTPPVLLVLGKDDRVVPPAQSANFQQAMVAAGRDCTLIEIEAVGHSFVGGNEQTTRKASLQALEATFAFFRRVAPPES
jgi:acetyl esterase/lipase